MYSHSILSTKVDANTKRFIRGQMPGPRQDRCAGDAGIVQGCRYGPVYSLILASILQHISTCQANPSKWSNLLMVSEKRELILPDLDRTSTKLQSSRQHVSTTLSNYFEFQISYYIPEESTPYHLPSHP